jgi:hypothetical protein
LLQLGSAGASSVLPKPVAQIFAAAASAEEDFLCEPPQAFSLQPDKNVSRETFLELF